MTDNIILNCYMQIGDRVQVNWSDTSDGWQPRPNIPENGTQGTVIGFDRYIRVEDRFNYKQVKPGIYSHNGQAMISWDNGSYAIVSAHDVCFVNAELQEIRRNDKIYREAFEIGFFISDLPETKYQVGNIVSFTWSDKKPGKGIITNIDYLQNVKKEGEICFNIRLLLSDTAGNEFENGSTYINESQITDIIDEGNYVRWDRGERDSLKFKDLREECQFFQSLNKINQIQNPATGNYGWTIPEIDKAIREGTVHLVGQSLALFGSEPFPTAYVMDDDLEDLKQRVREKWIADSNTALKQ